jgi:diketogulonate reductase-like aldo/keto reductase
MVYKRRNILKLYGLGGLALAAFPTLLSFTQTGSLIKRPIPSSGEKLPVVGLGTWQTFDAGSGQEERQPLVEVLDEMRRLGGTVIDSSPMYGRSEEVVGQLTQVGGQADHYFYATKVWTSGREAGIRQMDASFEKMQRKTLDLMQVHNLVDWKTHVKTLRAWKEQGKLRYWGLTHYVDSAHETLEGIIRAEKPDFVQFNYSLRSRNAEKSLFNTCQQNGTAVIINQPYESGSLFRAVRNKELPAWAAEYDINSWGQFFLKFILSNEAVTCVIPGTSKPHHMIDNMQAAYGRMPDNNAREKMVKAVLG